MHALITGTAGFIGFHVTNQLLGLGWQITGIDNINDYYDTRIKFDRLREAGIHEDKILYGKPVVSQKYPGYSFLKLNLEDRKAIDMLFERHGPFDVVINLAAQAGVRYSLTNPHTYIESNIVGFLNLLENCRHHKAGHLVYASSSSVYGLNETIPFSENDSVDHPISLYAASKKSNELMAHTYSHLFGLPTTGLRFFTVYGPWGRPDMALFLFTKAIYEGQPINVFNHGNMERDFTYISDIADGVIRVAKSPASPLAGWTGAHPSPAGSPAPYRVYNIGNSRPVKLLHFIEAIEKYIGKKAVKNFMPMQPGDVPKTFADISRISNDLGYAPATPVEVGVAKFIDWYKDYYKV